MVLAKGAHLRLVGCDWWVAVSIHIHMCMRLIMVMCGKIACAVEIPRVALGSPTAFASSSQSLWSHAQAIQGSSVAVHGVCLAVLTVFSHYEITVRTCPCICRYWISVYVVDWIYVFGSSHTKGVPKVFQMHRAKVANNPNLFLTHVTLIGVVTCDSTLMPAFYETAQNPESGVQAPRLV